MSEVRPSLFARIFSKLNPLLSPGLIASCAFLFLMAISNVFAVYSALAEANFHTLPLRIFAVLLYAVPAAGILLLKKWARLLGLFLCAVASILGIFTFLAVSNADGAFIIITHGTVLYCLLSKKTRAIFTTQSP